MVDIPNWLCHSAEWLMGRPSCQHEWSLEKSELLLLLTQLRTGQQIRLSFVLTHMNLRLSWLYILFLRQNKTPA